MYTVSRAILFILVSAVVACATPKSTFTPPVFIGPEEQPAHGTMGSEDLLSEGTGAIVVKCVLT